MKTEDEKELRRIIKKGKGLLHAIAELERDLERYKTIKSEDVESTPADRRAQTVTEESVTVRTANGHSSATIKYKDGERPSKGTREDKDLSMIII